MPHRYFIKLSFNGTRYHGWQHQKNALSVQQEMEKALSLILRTEIKLTGAGRTDTGVHAREFYAHFDHDELSSEQRQQLIYKVNGFVSPDIVINDIIPVVKDAHARYDALSRKYQYFICRSKNPFNQDFAFHLYTDLDIAKMNEGAKVLFDYSDFTSFSKLHTNVKNHTCKLIEAYWEEKKDLLVFTITADRFLRSMVRAIVGTLLELGQNKISLEEFRQIIERKDRSAAGFSVPAKGLFLTHIEYPVEIFQDPRLKSWVR
ncbi:MAG: tRNA pseudouridine(38-40) synthase TruA [Bacteroidetes bacterium]|nr:tRNA pseudouridine(38-40) synthase TruA [Bacteroidota bacterium]